MNSSPPRAHQAEAWKAEQASDSGRTLAATDPNDHSALSRVRFAFMMEVAGAVFGPKSDFVCYRADPAALSMPVLVIVGKYDFSLGAAPLKTFAKELKKGRFVQLDESAHFSHQEQPQAFTSAAKGFLRQR
jgi:proline iminopeptidase